MSPIPYKKPVIQNTPTSTPVFQKPSYLRIFLSYLLRFFLFICALIGLYIWLDLVYHGKYYGSS